MSLKNDLWLQSSKIPDKSDSVDNQFGSQILANGDELTLALLYNTLIPRLFNYGMQMRQNKTIVMLCLEEVFKGFKNKREPLGDLKSANVYFFKTFRRLLNEKLNNKRSFFSSLYFRVCQFELLTILEDAGSPGQIESSEHDESERALLLLTCTQRDAILLKFYNEFNYQDVSVIMELRVDSVYDLVSKAIEVLSGNQKTAFADQNTNEHSIPGKYKMRKGLLRDFTTRINALLSTISLMKILIILALTCLYSCQRPDQTNVVQDRNSIEAENIQKGTKSWLIKLPKHECDAPNHQFCRRPQIEGYCSQTSYFTGDSLKIFTSTDPGSEYSIDIYRMGYYSGTGGRLMKSIDALKGKKQNVPNAGKNNLIECNWDMSHEMIIPEDWVSGVYLGKLTTQDSSQSYITFIVKDQRKADVMFQCSDLTWQAYNRWPYWHSMYDEGQVPWVNTNGARISFDRPYGIYVNNLPMDFNPLTNGSGEFLLWEFPLAYWLEKEGYDVTYTSNIDTHTDPEGLLRTKAFLSVGHDEYWTPTMYENVKQARDRGVNLLFLNGNSIDGTVYLDSSFNGIGNRITGRLPQRDFDNEQELVGASSYGVGYSDFVCRKTDHWVYEGTGLKDGDVIDALVGWEYHGFPLKSDTSSLVVLGRSKIKPNKYGDPKAPDHAATLYQTTSGSFVFNAGTCFWSLPLSKPPGYQNPVCNQGDLGSRIIDFSKDDPRIQQIMKNLLARAFKNPETKN